MVFHGALCSWDVSIVIKGNKHHTFTLQPRAFNTLEHIAPPEKRHWGFLFGSLQFNKLMPLGSLIITLFRKVFVIGWFSLREKKMGYTWFFGDAFFNR
jgi:hypothetical protein